MIWMVLEKFQKMFQKRIIRKKFTQTLTQVPDPFEKFNSFGEHNNEMLKNFLE